jgi:hypothetical protein
MRYLLVGNAPIDGMEASIRDADVIIQTNKCLHVDLIPRGKTKYVVITNTGTPSKKVVRHVRKLTTQNKLGDFSLVFARNEAYSLEKVRRLKAVATGIFRFFRSYRSFRCPLDKKAIAAEFKLIEIGADFSAQLDRRLMALGMKENQLPSTGLIAFEWIKTLMRPGDQLEPIGFTHQGWDGHPWTIEAQLVRPYTKE